MIIEKLLANSTHSNLQAASLFLIFLDQLFLVWISFSYKIEYFEKSNFSLLFKVWQLPDITLKRNYGKIII